MRGRGAENDQDGRGQAHRGRGRMGRGRGPPRVTEARFKGANSELPYLNYGASARENRPIEFLQACGEFAAVKFKALIAEAFWSSPPAYGEGEPEPEMPDADDIQPGPLGKAMMSEFVSDKKEWKADLKRIEEQKKSLFATVYGQLSESSRCEIKDDEDWEEGFADRDLLYLIARIRATHIARQSGNPRQDQERVRNKWLSMRMGPQETSFGFGKTVEDY